MFEKSSLVGAVSVFALVIAAPSARAEGMDDVGAALKDATGDYNPMFALTRLNTFKLGKKCWAKLPGKDSGFVHTASSATREIVAYAKTITGEDWDDLEGSGSTESEKNKDMVAAKVDAFKDKFFITVNVEGDDCDAGRSSLWIRYWSQLASAVNKYPPPSGKVFITLNVNSKVKAVTSEVSKDGTTFTFTAPKDIEAKQYNDRLERPFRQLHSGLADDFAFGLKESTGDYNPAWVLTKFHTFKVGKKCLARLGDKEQSAIHTAGFVTRDILAWAKDAMGAEDWDQIEGQSANDPKFNRDLVDKDMDAFKKKFSFAISIDGDDCDASHGALWLRYWHAISSALMNYPPKAKKVAITLTVSSKAKDFTATVGKDGSTFVMTGPKDKEAPYTDKVSKAFEKVARKKK